MIPTFTTKIINQSHNHQSFLHYDYYINHQFRFHSCIQVIHYLSHHNSIKPKPLHEWNRIGFRLQTQSLLRTVTGSEGNARDLTCRNRPTWSCRRKSWLRRISELQSQAIRDGERDGRERAASAVVTELVRATERNFHSRLRDRILVVPLRDPD